VSRDRQVLIATSNPGKLRDFAAAVLHGIEISVIPGFSSLPAVVEDGLTLTPMQKRKPEAYSLYVPGQMVVADDSGWSRRAERGPGALCPLRRPDLQNKEPHLAEPTPTMRPTCSPLRELQEFRLPDARTICLRARRRRDGKLCHISGKAEGIILDAPQGAMVSLHLCFISADPKKTFGAERRKKTRYSHRGARFTVFWSGFQRARTIVNVLDFVFVGHLSLTSYMLPMRARSFPPPEKRLRSG